MCFGEHREFKAEIGTRCDVDGLKNTFGFGAIDDLELSGVITRNSTTKLGLLIDADADSASHISEIGDAVEATTQVTPDWLDLSNAEQNWVHEPKDVEGHLLGGECANAVSLDFLCDHVGLVHEASATSPAK